MELFLVETVSHFIESSTYYSSSYLSFPASSIFVYKLSLEVTLSKSNFRNIVDALTDDVITKRVPPDNFINRNERI